MITVMNSYSKTCSEYYLPTLNSFLETKNEFIDSAYYNNQNSGIERFTNVYWSSNGIDSVVHRNSSGQFDKFILTHMISDLTGIGREDYQIRYWSNDTLYGTSIIFHDGVASDTNKVIIYENSYSDNEEFGYMIDDTLIIKNKVNVSDSEMVINSNENPLNCTRNGIDAYGDYYTLKISVVITADGYIVKTIKNQTIVQDYIFKSKKSNVSLIRYSNSVLDKSKSYKFRLNGAIIRK